MVEVEVKVKINDINTCISSFLDMGYIREAYVEEIDTYYTSSFHDFKANDEALRVRESKDLISGKKKACVTYKGKKLDKVSMSRNELETFVDDAAVMKQIFENAGFVAVTPVEKIRLELSRGNVTVCVDDVKGLGGFLELEMLVRDESMRESALNELERILKSIGMTMADTIRKSYLSMLEEKITGK